MRLFGGFPRIVLAATLGLTLLPLSAQVKGQPYSAISKITTVQKLVNGTTITNERITIIARDSEGRTYRDQELPIGPNGARSKIHMFSIFDQVAKTDTHWNSNSKLATIVHVAGLEPRSLPAVPPPSSSPATASVAGLGSGGGSGSAGLASAEERKSETTVEKLGGKTIQGIDAEGTRHTTIIPAGKEGNDRPITVVRERWFSQELKVMVLSTVDDPRSGLTTTELTNIERAEPDPSLFQLPEGYTVKDQYPGQEN